MFTESELKREASPREKEGSSLPQGRRGEGRQEEEERDFLEDARFRIPDSDEPEGYSDGWRIEEVSADGKNAVVKKKIEGERGERMESFPRSVEAEALRVLNPELTADPRFRDAMGVLQKKSYTKAQREMTEEELETLRESLREETRGKPEGEKERREMIERARSLVGEKDVRATDPDEPIGFSGGWEVVKVSDGGGVTLRKLVAIEGKRPIYKEKIINVKDLKRANPGYFEPKAGERDVSSEGAEVKGGFLARLGSFLRRKR